MQKTHHLKPAGVNATRVVYVSGARFGSSCVILADGVQIIVGEGMRGPSGNPFAGGFFLVHPDGKAEFMAKSEFESRYEPCDPDLRPQFHSMPPADVIAAAHHVGRYFTKQNIDEWELGPCMARVSRAKLHINHASSADILAALRADRDKVTGPLRRAYNDVCERLDVLNSLREKIAEGANIGDSAPTQSSAGMQPGLDAMVAKIGTAVVALFAIPLRVLDSSTTTAKGPSA